MTRQDKRKGQDKQRQEKTGKDRTRSDRKRQNPTKYTTAVQSGSKRKEKEGHTKTDRQTDRNKGR